MSPNVATPTVEQSLAILGKRVRHLEALEIKLPVFDARAFGATGSGYPIDDTPAIRRAMDAAANTGSRTGTVLLADPPGGHYYVGPSELGAYPYALKILDGVSVIGTGWNCELRARGNYAIFKPDDATWVDTFTIKGLKLVYEGTHSNPGWTNANAIEWRNQVVGPNTYYPNNYTIQDVWIYDAYHGFYDQSYGWGGIFINVITQGCRYGFRKTTSGTTMLFIGCYAKGTDGAHHSGVHWDIKGWEMNAIMQGTTLINCAMDHYIGNELAHFEDQHGLYVTGFDFESNRATNPGGEATLLLFRDCYATIQGFKGNANFLGENPGEAGNANLVGTYGASSSLNVESCILGPSVTSRKLGDIRTIHTEGTKVSVRGGRAKDIAGTGVPRGIALTSGGGIEELTLDRVDYDQVFNPNTWKVVVMDEISVGALNSGGAGFKLLRVPNVSDTT